MDEKEKTAETKPQETRSQEAADSEMPTVIALEFVPDQDGVGGLFLPRD